MILSVSAIGSSSLQQHERLVCAGADCLSVSAIGSSSLQLETGMVSLDYVNFQYPQSDRVVCNAHILPGIASNVYLSVSAIGSSSLQQPYSTGLDWPVKNFQYPQSDRVVCNSTRFVHPTLSHSFQYPQSDRVVCNIRLSGMYGRVLFFQLSAIGSSSLQPLQNRAIAGRLGLSVSAIGSSSLQREMSETMDWADKTFSIRNRIE